MGTKLRDLIKGVKFKNPMKASDLTKLAFVFWLLMATNIIHQVGHLSEVGNFTLYILWKIITHEKINLPMLIINHLFRCWNQRRVSLPYMQDHLPDYS